MFSEVVTLKSVLKYWKSFKTGGTNLFYYLYIYLCILRGCAGIKNKGNHNSEKKYMKYIQITVKLVVQVCRKQKGRDYPPALEG
jgi:hypothetical protein